MVHLQLDEEITWYFKLVELLVVVTLVEHNIVTELFSEVNESLHIVLESLYFQTHAERLVVELLKVTCRLVNIFVEVLSLLVHLVESLLNFENVFLLTPDVAVNHLGLLSDDS